MIYKQQLNKIFFISSVTLFSMTHSYANTTNTQTYGYNFGYTNTNTSTNTCTVNGVVVDCATGEPIGSSAPPRSELCPERQFEPIYGYYCDHKIDNIRFHAVKIQHYGGGAGFPGNAQLDAAYRMNDNTDIVGEAITLNGETHAVRTNVGDGYYSNMYFTDLGSPGFASSARAINNIGTSLGSSQTNSSGASQIDGVWHSQLSPSFYALSSLGNSRGVTNGVARNRYYTEFATGYSVWNNPAGDSQEHGFIWTFNGSSQSTQIIGSHMQANRAMAINDSKIVVGFVYNGSGKRAYKWQNNSLNMLNDNSQSLDINNNSSAIIVGYSYNTSGQKMPFKWKNNTMTALPNLTGSYVGEAKAVTDAGDIVGSSGNRAAFWRDNTVYDLNIQLDNSITTTLTEAVDINRRGRILAKGGDGYYILIPSEQY